MDTLDTENIGRDAVDNKPVVLAIIVVAIIVVCMLIVIIFKREWLERLICSLLRLCRRGQNGERQTVQQDNSNCISRTITSHNKPEGNDRELAQTNNDDQNGEMVGAIAYEVNGDFEDRNGEGNDAEYDDEDCQATADQTLLKESKF